MRYLTLAILAVSSLASVVSAARAQGVHSAAAPMQVWNRTSQGMSTNAALAFYRVQNVGRPAAQSTAWPQYSRTPTVVAYPMTPGYSANPYVGASPYAAAGTPVAQLEKPFAAVRPPRTTFDRYWPYLMEAYEDPETGFIIWTLP